MRDKYRIDELYGALIVRPLQGLSRNVLARGVDQGLIDGLGVNGVARVFRAIADDALKYAQTGYAQSYLFVMLVGGAILIGWLVRGS